MKLFKGSYFHSSSEEYGLEIIAKNAKEALKKANEIADGLGMINIHEVKNLKELISAQAYKFAKQNGWITIK